MVKLNEGLLIIASYEKAGHNPILKGNRVGVDMRADALESLCIRAWDRYAQRPASVGAARSIDRIIRTWLAALH